MSTYEFFAPPEHFRTLSPHLACVICVLNFARTGNTTAAIHASSKGYRIVIDGKTVAKGKTPEELSAAFKRAVDKVKAGMK